MQYLPMRPLLYISDIPWQPLEPVRYFPLSPLRPFIQPKFMLVVSAMDYGLFSHDWTDRVQWPYSQLLIVEKSTINGTNQRPQQPLPLQ